MVTSIASYRLKTRLSANANAIGAMMECQNDTDQRIRPSAVNTGCANQSLVVADQTSPRSAATRRRSNLTNVNATKRLKQPFSKPSLDR